PVDPDRKWPRRAGLFLDDGDLWAVGAREAPLESLDGYQDADVASAGKRSAQGYVEVGDDDRVETEKAASERRGCAPRCQSRDRKSTRLNSSHVSISYAV